MAKARRPAVAVLLLLTAVAVAPATATPSALSMEVRPAFGGSYRLGGWLPVWVSLENRGPEQRGRLSLRLGASLLTAEVELPSPARKRYYLELPAESHALAVEAVLETGAGRLESTAPVTPLSTRIPIVAALDGSYDSAEPRIAPRDLPERWSGYDVAHQVHLAAEAVAELRPEQRQALADWVRLGGRVELTAARPERLRPVLKQWLQAPEPPLGADGSQVFRRGRGLVRLNPAARGRSIAVADPPLPPEPGTERTPALGYSSDAARPRHGGALALYALVYLAVAGLLLAPWGRTPAGAWRAGAALAAAAVFASAAPRLGLVAGGGAVPATGQTVLHVRPGEPLAFVDSRWLLASPRRETLELETPLAGGVIESLDPGGGAFHRIDLSAVERLAVPAPMWGSVRVRVRGFRAYGLEIETGRGAPRLHNRSRTALTACARLGSRGWESLPDLPPNGSLPIAGAEGLAGEVLVRCVFADSRPDLVTARPLRPAGGATLALFHLPVPDAAAEVAG